MATAIAIHIGLDSVDPDAYQGWAGELAACENDATALQELTSAVGYDTRALLTSEATADAVLGSIEDAASQLSEGDICVITYAGHGGQFDDLEGEEPDSKDETWVLYDREILDDEIREMLAGFAAGVRVVVLSDSCHSGTVIRALYQDLVESTPTVARAYEKVAPELRSRVGSRAARAFRFRSIPSEIQAKVLKAHKALYTGIRARTAKRGEITTAASVILLSGCQDNQEAGEKDGHGFFTAALLDEWGGGAFTGDYRALHAAILVQMPPTQAPNYMTDGAPWPAFEAQVPFTIDAPAISGEEPWEPELEESEDPWSSDETGDAPQVSGPTEPMSRSDTAPCFSVSTRSHPYYIFEITSDPDLFDGENREGDRASSNWYSSWDDPQAPVRLVGELYWLPDEAWEALRGNDLLWFRIGTTPAEDSWDGYTVSTADDDGYSAPSLQIVSAEERSQARQTTAMGST